MRLPNDYTLTLNLPYNTNIHNYGTSCLLSDYLRGSSKYVGVAYLNNEETGCLGYTHNTPQHTHTTNQVSKHKHMHCDLTLSLSSLFTEVLHCFLRLLQLLLTQDHSLCGEVSLTGVLQLGHGETRQAGLEVHRRDATVLQVGVIQVTAATAAAMVDRKSTTR